MKLKVKTGILTTLVATGIACLTFTSVSAAAAPSPSPSPPGLSTLKAKAAIAISNREDRLTTLINAIDSNTSISTANKEVLLVELKNDKTGLLVLKTTIQSESTLKACLPEVRSISTNYRVYLLEGPKVKLILEAGNENTVENNLSDLLSKAKTAINSSSSAKKVAAQNAYEDGINNLNAAQSLFSPVITTIIGLTHSQYPGANSILKSATLSLSKSKNDLVKCRRDLLLIKRDLS